MKYAASLFLTALVAVSGGSVFENFAVFLLSMIAFELSEIQEVIRDSSR